MRTAALPVAAVTVRHDRAAALIPALALSMPGIPAYAATQGDELIYWSEEQHAINFAAIPGSLKRCPGCGLETSAGHRCIPPMRDRGAIEE